MKKMNVIYSNLKIALWSEDEGIRRKLKKMLSEHQILDVDPEITPNALMDILENNRADFIFLDADKERMKTIDRLNALQNSDCNVLSVVFLSILDQKFVSELKECGADAIIRKDRVSDQLLGYMSFLLEHKDILHARPESTIRRLGHVAALFLTNSPKDAIHLLMGYFVR